MIGVDRELRLEDLDGVGPRRLEEFERLGIRAASDLPLYLPRDWQDRRPVESFDSPLSPGPATVRARVVHARAFAPRPGFGFFKASLETGFGRVEAVWFKRSSRAYDVFARLKKEIVPGADIWVVGRSEGGLLGTGELRVEEHYLADDPKAGLHVGRLVPIYPLTEGLTQRFMREAVFEALSREALPASESLPAPLLEKRGLLAASQALRGIHFPGSAEELRAARERLSYEELLSLELAWILKRRQAKGVAKGFAYEVKKSLLTPFRERLGFELTHAQKRVINEIFDDMRATAPMTRLLQGDVGSGKTVVALSALLLAVENGFQGAFMAPTEILAEQHLETLRRFLVGLPVRFEALTSRATAARRRQILGLLERGEIDILVGTHALLEGGVRFKNLRLAVVDEQHRFGVRQRASLRQKGETIDLLIMTATPIPRTLALSLYGDLDVSTLDEMPPGRVPAETFRCSEEKALEILREETRRGRQGYVVFPVIEDSPRREWRSAKAEFVRLAAGPLKDLRLGLLHGALPGIEKARVMREFSEGGYDVLVATSVVEVGVDAPKATVMVIENAERFGLASLHQLRGRVGRRGQSSRCLLIGDPKSEEAARRLEAMERIKDGFRIAEEDLKLRGPGELLGIAQHGDVTLRAADIVRDAGLVAWAREDAEEILSRDPRLGDPANAGLRAALLKRYQGRWNWFDLA